MKEPAAAKASIAVQEFAPDYVRIVPDTGLATFADIPSTSILKDVSRSIELADAAPHRRKGTSKHLNIISLAAHASRFRDENSVAFIDDKSGVIRIVYNYDCAGGSMGGVMGGQRWRDNIATWSPTAHEAWTRWTNNAGEWLSPVDFAEHLEASVADLQDPPDEGDKSTPQALIQLPKLLRTEYGKPTDIMAVAKSFKVQVDTGVEATQTLQSGEMVVSYSETHKTQSAEGKVTVPGLFIIGVPRFEGDPMMYRIPIKLRYRMRGGSVVWRYEMHNEQEVERAAWAGLANTLARLVETPEQPWKIGSDAGEPAADPAPARPEPPPPFPIFFGSPEPA